MTKDNQAEGNQEQRTRVMIVDDVQATRRTTRIMLASNSLVEVVAIAHNGLEAVEMARDQKPDVVLMDVNMPEMDGIAAAEQILSDQPDLYCIMITAARESHVVRDAMAAGARGYLIKPFTVDELDEAILKANRYVQMKRRRQTQTRELIQQRNIYIQQLARTFAKERRTDDKAMQVFEQLADDPYCDIRWLMNLGMIYIIRKRWGKLKRLAERLEQRSKRQEK